MTRTRSQVKLPLDDRWASEDKYVESLLSFATNCDIFRNLCGGIHILDFLTRKPDLYTTVVPADWRDWFNLVEVEDVLELLLRADLSQCSQSQVYTTQAGREVVVPPRSLLEYVDTIRMHCLQRQFQPVHNSTQSMPRHISVGMKPKKIHEVSNFAAYVDHLSGRISEKLGEPISLVDFGSGQNYLGRTLACPPYNRHVIAIERKHHNVQGARGMDVHAKLAKRQKIMRNKKEYKKMLATMNGMLTPEESDIEAVPVPEPVSNVEEAKVDGLGDETGSIMYVEHNIENGHLENILHHAVVAPSVCKSDFKPVSQSLTRRVMTISLHSCGNLSHHGIRSLILEPSVSAVAIIGCCYNLLTERLGPTTYKLPQLRPNHPRLEATSSTYDPHGFPMSKTLEDFHLTSPPSTSEPNTTEKGVRLNITARMMAVQAPYNWGPVDSEAFFRRHFYRALLQRMLLDRGVVKQALSPADVVVGGSSLSGQDENDTPLIVGTLRKHCFTSFRRYVRGALEKLTTPTSATLKGGADGSTGTGNKDNKITDESYEGSGQFRTREEADFIGRRTANISDAVINEYEENFGYAKKNLAIIWSLMAFSAGVVESIIVVDRWLYLREQPCVADAWVESVFDYKLSPRNLVVVGIKKTNDQTNKT